ncbi:MAG: hypothetical protein U0354_11850 [Candidatus Sericytochromatia bacterium]
MRRFTAWLNMIATFAILLIYYTGLNTLTNQSISYDINIYLTFMFTGVVLASTINSMLYINTLHKDIEEVQKNDKVTDKIVMENEK